MRRRRNPHDPADPVYYRCPVGQFEEDDRPHKGDRYRVSRVGAEDYQNTQNWGVYTDPDTGTKRVVLIDYGD
jgi:hypothetical protein